MSLETQFRSKMAELDPRSRAERFVDYKMDHEVFIVRWNTLGFSMSTKHSLNREVFVQALYDPTFDLRDQLLNEVVESIIEGYIEYWHLYYEGDMNLRDFMGWSVIEAVQYIDSEGNYKGVQDHARVKRLQQRDFGRFAAPERVIGADE